MTYFQPPSHPVPALRYGSTRLRPLKSNFLAARRVAGPFMLVRHVLGLCFRLNSYAASSASNLTALQRP